MGIWWCVLDHNPGHVYYDIVWDEKLGWKPIPPQTSADDHLHGQINFMFEFVKTL